MHDDDEDWSLRWFLRKENYPAIPRDIRPRKTIRINCRAIINLRRHNARNNC